MSIFGINENSLELVRSQPKEIKSEISKEDIIKKACQLAKSANFTSKHIDIALAQKSQTNNFDKKQLKVEIFKDNNTIKTNFKSKDKQNLYYSKSVTSKDFQREMKSFSELDNRTKLAQSKNDTAIQLSGMEKPKKEKSEKDEVKEEKKKYDKENDKKEKDEKAEKNNAKDGQDSPAKMLEDAVKEQQQILKESLKNLEHELGGSKGNSTQAPLKLSNDISQSSNELLSSIKQIEEELAGMSLIDPKRFELEEKLSNLNFQYKKMIDEKAKEEFNQNMQQQQEVEQEKESEYELTMQV